MSKGSLFSDREWTEVAEGYRRSGWWGKARVWLYVFIAAIIATATVLSIVWIVGAALSEKPATVSDANNAAPQSHATPSATGTFDYEIDGLNVTFGTRAQSRVGYGQFSLVVQCPTEECLQWMKMNRASLRDAVYTVSMRQYLENFKDTTGVENFKKAILEEMQSRFPNSPPKSLLIRDWFLK